MKINSDDDAIRCFRQADNYRFIASLHKQRKRFLDYLSICHSSFGPLYAQKQAWNICKTYYEEKNFEKNERGASFYGL